MLTKVKPALQLKDTSLFRQQCYIDGKWVDADDKSHARRATIRRTARRSARCRTWARPKPGARSRPPTPHGRRGARRPPRNAAAILRKWFDLMMANQEDLARADDGRAGQAARRIARRDRLRRVVHRMVRRGRQAHLRRHDPAAPGRQAHRRHQAADRRVRGGHAVEFPQRDDHAQGRPGAGRRLHHGDQARDARRRIRRWRCANWPSAPASRRA